MACRERSVRLGMSGSPEPSSEVYLRESQRVAGQDTEQEAGAVSETEERKNAADHRTRDDVRVHVAHSRGRGPGPLGEW